MFQIDTRLDMTRTRPHFVILWIVALLFASSTAYPECSCCYGQFTRKPSTYERASKTWSAECIFRWRQLIHFNQNTTLDMTTNPTLHEDNRKFIVKMSMRLISLSCSL